MKAGVCSSPGGRNILVIDTAAIIKQVQLARYESDLYTVNEVLQEVRDKISRNFLATVSSSIKVREPHPDDVKRGSGWSFLFSRPFQAAFFFPFSLNS
jgi:rRNA maturation endonuclease Nob1